MKIYINCRFLTQRITGVQRFAYEICCELDKLLNDYPSLQIIGLMPNRPIKGQYEHVFTNIQLQQCGRFSGHLWEQLELPFFARSGFLVNLCNVAPLFHFRQFITLHDVIFMTNMDSQKWWFKLWYRLIARFTSYFSRHIFTVSEFSKAEICKLLKTESSKITVLGNAASLQRYPYRDEILSQLDILPNGYFLMIGSSSIRKNTKIVAQLFANNSHLSNYKLVIVGGEYVNLGAVSTTQAENIIYTGYIDDGELRSLYHNAHALIFPSTYEGFGIPVIEAMAEDCPVIVADIPVMHEICGASAIYFNPHETNELQQRLALLLNDRSILVENVLLLKMSLKYQWSQFANILINRVFAK